MSWPEQQGHPQSLRSRSRRLMPLSVGREGGGVGKSASQLPSSALKAPAIEKVKVRKGGVTGSLKRINPVNRAQFQCSPN